MFLQFWHLWNKQRRFLVLLMRFGVHGSTRFLILVFIFLNYDFFVFVLDAIFCGTTFFILQDTVWLVKKSWWVHCCSNHQFYWLSDCCGSGFALWWSLSERICRHKLVVSTSFWSWLLNASLVLTFEKHSDIFCGVSALWVCWHFMGVLSFRFWSFCFWNMSFFVFILDAIFCCTNLFIFQEIVWLVKSSWCVPCCSNPQFYWFSDRCRSGYALWWSLSERICRHKLVVSTSFWSWLLNVSSVLTSLKYTATLFLACQCVAGLLKIRGSTNFSILVFMFLKYVIFCVYPWCDLLWYKFFHFSGHWVAS